MLFVPELRLPTDDMRAALPATVPLKDAVANLSAVAIGVAGMAIGRYELLGRLTVDRIHEQYRAAVYPQLPRMVAAAREAGAIGAFLSGAGSTILAFTDSMSGITRIESAFIAAAADSDLPGSVRVVEPRNAGGRVSRPASRPSSRRSRRRLEQAGGLNAIVALTPGRHRRRLHPAEPGARAPRRGSR